MISIARDTRPDNRNGHHKAHRRRWSVQDTPEDLRPALDALASFLGGQGYTRGATGRILRHAAEEGTLAGLVERGELEPADLDGATEAFVAAMAAVPIADEQWGPAIRLVPPELEDDEMELDYLRSIESTPAREGHYPPLTLAEEVDHEALGYRSLETPFGDFLASQLERLAQLVRFAGARTGAEFVDRMDTLDQEARDQWYRDGYRAGKGG